MSKKDILLRSLNNPPLVTKGSTLTLDELDANFVELYNALVALSDGSNIPAYDNSILYSIGAYVSYSGQAYKMINAAPQVNVTPGTDTLTWIEVYATDLVAPPGDTIYSFSKTIPTAEVLTLGTTEVDLVSAPGAGKAIVLIEAINYSNKDSLASPPDSSYSTNTDLRIGYNGNAIAGTDYQFSLTQALNTNVRNTRSFIVNNPSYSPDVKHIRENSALQVKVPGGNPTAGTFDITIKGTYKIIDILD